MIESHMIRKAIEIFVSCTKPLVWRIAELYDIRINRHCMAQGEHPLLIDDFKKSKRHNIPKSVYFNTRSGMIHVKENTVFGEDVLVITGKHYNIEEARNSDVPLHHVPEKGRDIIIGKGCYIGSSAILIGGINIGDYAVIGAGAVVTKDVPERTFVAGVPAKEIRKL